MTAIQFQWSCKCGAYGTSGFAKDSITGDELQQRIKKAHAKAQISTVKCEISPEIEFIYVLEIGATNGILHAEEDADFTRHSYA